MNNWHLTNTILLLYTGNTNLTLPKMLQNYKTHNKFYTTDYNKGKRRSRRRRKRRRRHVAKVSSKPTSNGR
jgi:hypothetical protein